MALSYTFNVCTTCNTVSLTETVGDYDATDNPGGWGAPNLDRGDAQSITLEVYTPGNLTGDPVLTYDLLTNSPAPDASGYYTYDFVPADFGMSDYIQSGGWAFVVTIVDDQGVTLPPIYKYVAPLAHLRTGLKAALLQVDHLNLAAHEETFNNWLLLSSANTSFCCGQLDNGQEQVDFLYDLIENDCNC